MNKRFLKRVRDNMPESLKKVTAYFIRNKLLTNNEFCKYYNILQKRETMLPESIKEYQLNELRNILTHSFENVPYYTELFKSINFNPEKINSFDDIKVIPYLTKDLIRLNFENLKSIKKISGGSYSTTTSGSTGEPLKIFLDYDSFFRETAFIYYYRRKLGYRFEDKVVTFRGIGFGDKLYSLNPVNNETIFSPFKLSAENLDIYRKKINEIKPAYLNGYISAIYYFAKLLSDKSQSLEFQLKGIFLTSENINESERLFVESFFNVKTITFYGHTERCVIAQEFKQGEYRFDPFYGYTEHLNLHNDVQEIIGTGFLNKTMPLIRYKTNDTCRITADDMITISGRRDTNDFMIGINDEKITHPALHILSDILVNVTNYQFIQEEKGRAVLLIVPNKDFHQSEIPYIKNAIERNMKGVIEFEIKIGDKLILSPGGKYQMFINNIRNQQS
jgi:phenylacetate-CoA ligase